MKLKKPDQKTVWRLLCAVATVLLLAGLIPLLLIGQYAHPCADDFTYGFYAHMSWINFYSVPQALQAALMQVKSSYETWQGTFSSIFLMAVSPAVWSETDYFWTPLLQLGILVFSNYYLTYVLIVRLLHGRKIYWGIVAPMLSFMLMETVYSPVNAFFWFNGSVHYHFMHGCMLILIGLELHLSVCARKGRRIFLTAASVLCAVLCGGANYSTALLTLICLVTICGLVIIAGQKPFWQLPALAAEAVSFVISIIAPGNAVRQTSFVKMGAVEAILASFRTAYAYGKVYLTPLVLLVILFLLPVLIRLAAESSFRFRMPWLVTLYSVGLASCVYTPALYSMTYTGPDRLMNIAKMWFLFLLLVNVFYWIGFVQKKLPAKREENGKRTAAPIILAYCAAVLCLFLVDLKISDQPLKEFSSYAAWVSLRSGEAAQYDEEYQQRLEILLSEEKNVVLQDYSVKPYLLYFDDVTEDAANWKNTAVANWYVKETVVLQSAE
ncbi:MAG: DUF6056 family protein [Lachnospiraceae bacterium]|nr:DUF6056 family protein [Lachnospiraceae bacterium]